MSVFQCDTQCSTSANKHTLVTYVVQPPVSHTNTQQGQNFGSLRSTQLTGCGHKSTYTHSCSTYNVGETIDKRPLNILQTSYCRFLTLYVKNLLAYHSYTSTSPQPVMNLKELPQEYEQYIQDMREQIQQQQLLRAIKKDILAKQTARCKLR